MDDAIQQILKFLFVPPEVPKSAAPFFVKVLPAGRRVIAQAWTLVYHQGVTVGFLTGVLVTLAVAYLVKRARGK
jgi:hypothetical protein